MDENDQKIMDAVRAAHVSPEDASEGLIDMIMTGYDLTLADTLVAELVEQRQTVGVRGEASPVFMSFEVDGVTVDIEVTGDGVVGSVSPASSGRIALEQPPQRVTADLTSSGSFDLAMPAKGPFRLSYQPEEGPPITTVWVLP